MATWLSIRYLDFWTVPRIFLVEHAGSLFLFDCAFNDDTEDYPDRYQVYLMPPLTEQDLAESWAGLHKRALVGLGEAPIADVVFDPTRRKSIDACTLSPFIDKANRLSRPLNGSVEVDGTRRASSASTKTESVNH